MGVGQIFSRGRALEDFSKFFQEGTKSGEICFSHSKLKKQPFLLKMSKSRGSLAPLPPLSSNLLGPRWVHLVFARVFENVCTLPKLGNNPPYST